MASSIVSNSIKNGIIFVLLILIVHFAAKNALESDARPAVPQQAPQAGPSSFRAPGTPAGAPMPTLAASPPSAAVTESHPPPPSASSDSMPLKHPPPPHDHDDALLAYVFGASTPPSPSSTSSSYATLLAGGAVGAGGAAGAIGAGGLPSSPVSAAGSDAAAHHGCMVVGKYNDENVMCGGAIFEGAGGLQGFDGTSSHFSWSSSEGTAAAE